MCFGDRKGAGVYKRLETVPGAVIACGTATQAEDPGVSTRKSVSRIPGVPRVASRRYYLSVSHHETDHPTSSMFITAGVEHVCSSGIRHVCSAVPGFRKSQTSSFFPKESCVYCSTGLWHLSEKPVPLPPHRVASLKVIQPSDFFYSLWLLYQNPLNT